MIVLPPWQVQLLNQGDIEVDFRLVHREGKFAPRPGEGAHRNQNTTCSPLHFPVVLMLVLRNMPSNSQMGITLKDLRKG